MHKSADVKNSLNHDEKPFSLIEENNKSKSTENVEIKKETHELRPKSKVKSENYIHIPGWAVCELGLKGNELLIYSIIFGFSQEENQTFRGSLRYLMDWTNSSKVTVIKILKSLLKKDLIGKIERFENGIKFCDYYAKKLKDQKVTLPTLPVVKKLNHPGKETLPHNIGDNIDTNSINRISNKYIRAKACASVPIEQKNNKCAKSFDAHSKLETQYLQGKEQCAQSAHGCANAQPLIENKNTEPLSASKNKSLRKSKPKLAPKVLEEEFDTVWDLYPKKKDKTRAFKAFSKARKEGVPLEKIREGVQKYVQEIENTGIAHQYIKYGSTWFNNKCWEDEYDTNAKSSYDLNAYEKSMDTFSSEPEKPPERLGLWL